MILQETGEYGALSSLVSGAGTLIAAAGALALGFRGRAKWEPSEQDVDRGPQKVGGLLIAVTIAVLWTQTRNLESLPFLTRTAFILVGSTVAALIVYGILISVFSYDRSTAPGGEIVKEKIIGGFWLTKAAKNARDNAANANPPVTLTPQELLHGAGNDPDKVWPRLSRALAKAAFVIFYLALTASGTIALTCASIIFGLSS
jgi:hypothetical protein